MESGSAREEIKTKKKIVKTALGQQQQQKPTQTKTKQSQCEIPTPFYLLYLNMLSILKKFWN